MLNLQSKNISCWLTTNKMFTLQEPTVSRSEFRRALNFSCIKELGCSLNDLPDIIDLDDVWWEGITMKESLQMIKGCIEDFKDA